MKKQNKQTSKNSYYCVYDEVEHGLRHRLEIRENSFLTHISVSSEDQTLSLVQWLLLHTEQARQP